MSFTKLSHLSKKNIIIWLIIIGLSSLFLKLCLIDFSVPETGDSWIYILRAIANSQGNYAETPEKTQGWNLFLSPFFLIIDSDNYLDYVNIARILSIIISTITILPMYLLARIFFNEKYSLLATCFFSFQPQLNYNASLGFSEPLFFLILISSIFLLLNRQSNLNVFFSFTLLGLLFWSRFIGLVFVLPFIISYFVIYYNSKNLLRNFIICGIIFLVIISPILILRYIQYENPLYYWNPIPLNCCDEIGLETFHIGLNNTFHVLGIVALPYLIFLFPIGMYYSFLKIKEGNKKFLVNWIFLASLITPFVIASFSLTNEARHLFHIYPFLMIFATLTIHEIVENKIKPLSSKQKTIFLITILIFIITTSSLVTVGINSYGYGKPDVIKINEIRDYSKFLINNLDGKLFWSKGVDSDWIWVVMIEESNGAFKNYKINPNFHILFDEVTNLKSTNLYVLSSQELEGNSLKEIISNGELIGLRYISVGDTNDLQFFDDVYNREENYDYLNKIFDSTNNGFQKYKVKTFEINYEKFHLLYNQTTL